MFQKFIKFIKYNNAAIVIIVLFFVIGTGVFASETGQELLGKKSVEVEGVDNTLLLGTDLDKMDMDFSIQDISEDDKYYYVKYIYLDLDKKDGVWEYQLKEKNRKISKKSRVNLDKYLIEELKEEYQARIKYLKKQREKAENIGLEKKVEISKYSGLIGKTLTLAENIFEDYESVKLKELPTPINTFALKELKSTGEDGIADSLTDVYDDYINKNDPDKDDILNNNDNCPNDYNPNQGDRDNDSVGDVCDLDPDVVPGTDIATPTPTIIIDDEIATPTPEFIETEEEIENPIETSIEVSTEKASDEVPAEESSDPAITDPPINEEPVVIIVESEE